MLIGVTDLKRGNVRAKRGSPAPAGTDKTASSGPGGRRRPYGWLAAPVVAALVVARASAVPLPAAGTATQATAVIGLLAGSAVLAVTPGVALLSVVARFRRLGQATALGLLYAGAGITAMAGFWAWFASFWLGVGFDGAMLALSLVLIAIFGRRGDLGRLGLSRPLSLALAVSVLYTATVFLRGGPTANPAENVGSILWPQPDNSIPLFFAAKVATHAPLGGYLLGGWLSSDRPPLETGFALLQWPQWYPAGREGDYQFLGTVLQSAWLPALWVAFRVRGVPAGRTCAAVLATAATGVMYMNTVYVWPKMLAGALAISALAILVSRDPGDRNGVGPLVAVLTALSLLAHGGTSFDLLAFAPLVIRRRRAITTGAAAAGAAAMAALYVPWLLYQHFVNPPGNRLLKWMLAGVTSVDRRGALPTIIEQYRSLSLPQVLGNKGGNALTLLVNLRLLRQLHLEWTGGFYGSARIAELYFLVPAAGLLLLGALALLLPSARPRLGDVGPLAAFTALATAAWVALLWGGQSEVGPVTTQVHQGPYAAVTLFIGLCALGVTALPPWLAGVILTASAAWFAVEWLPGITIHPIWPYVPANSPVDWSMAIAGGCALAAIIVIARSAAGRLGDHRRADLTEAEPGVDARHRRVGRRKEHGRGPAGQGVRREHVGDRGAEASATAGREHADPGDLRDVAG